MRQVAKGFTMVELSLSIAFIAVLSIIVVVIIGNAVSAYHRGLTLNQLNTAGMDVVEDMRTAVQSSSARSAKRECAGLYNDANNLKKCENDNGLSFVYIERYAKVKIGATEARVPVYGAFCTGGYSYLWNSGYFFNNEYRVEGAGSASLTYRKAGNDNTSAAPANFKLLKMPDENRALCMSAANAGGNYLKNSDDSAWSTLGNTFDITSTPIEEDPVDLLEGNNNLAIYDLTTALPAESGNSQNMFYAVSFVLGTIQGGINVGATGNFCATPEGYNSGVENFDYCVINKFNFAAQATGG